MKKSIIIVVVISVCIVGGLILFLKFMEEGLKYLESEKRKTETEESKTETNTRVDIKDITMEIALLDICTLINEWYNVANKPRFETNSNNLVDVDKIIQSLKRREDIEAKYYIRTTAKSSVVKLMIVGANSFYCLDTIQNTKQIISIDNVKFESPTTCSGQTIP